MMQALRKIDGKWVEERPKNFTLWMIRHDGDDAVVKSDGVAYCGTTDLLAAYQGKGKKAAMFYDLAVLLPAPPGVPEASPLWCPGHDLLCSERPVCAADCQR